MSFPICPFPGSPAVKVTFVDHQELNVTGATQTFAGLSLGNPSSFRYVAVALAWVAAATLTNCTIGGVSASILIQRASGDSSNTNVAIVMALVPIGTTGTVVANFSATSTAASVAVYSVLGVRAPVTSSVASAHANNPSVTMNVPENGAVIAVSLSPSVAPLTAAWANLSLDVTSRYSVENRSAASAEFATTQTGIAFICTWSSAPFNPAVAAFAAFGP